MAENIKLVTDTACDLPQSLIDEHGISLVPLTVRFGDKEFVDRVELNQEQFWDRMQTTNILPSTAAPSPGAFEKAFREALDNGAKSVICITLSSNLSATHQAAHVAAKSLEGADVRVIDSGMCTVGQGLLVIEASKLASESLDVDTIIERVEDLKTRLKIFGALDTLENLKKGGRIGAAGAFFGSLLSIKPIISIEDGKVEPESRQRTRSRAIGYLANLVLQRAPIDRIAISHSNAADIEQFIDLLAPVTNRSELIVSEIGPVIGTHGGAGIIAVAFASKKDS